jgi:hypothetical protein
MKLALVAISKTKRSRESRCVPRYPASADGVAARCGEPAMLMPYPGKPRLQHAPIHESAGANAPASAPGRCGHT